MIIPRMDSGAVFVSSAALLIVAAFTTNHDGGVLVVTAMPSFGTRIPNGERVPCSGNTTTTTTAEDGCSLKGFCLGLGHHNCDGFASDDATIETGTRIVSLNPFGEDFKNANYEWTRNLCDTDSDKDGYTNGEELGDPCCSWEPGQLNGTTFDSIDGWVPTHPGMKDDAPPSGVAYDKTLLCGVAHDGGAADADDDSSNTNEEETAVQGAADDYYNANETRGEFDIIMKPYPIPIKTTTYTDFIFRLPEDLPDLVHIVYGEMLITQPKHLHHVVITGCMGVPDDSIQDGIPVDRRPVDCNVVLGGWAPGTPVFGNDKHDSSVGVAIGRAMGIEAIQLNIHYTDGEYEDAEKELYKMAEDGIKIYYTPDLRQYTAMAKQLIAVPWGPKEMNIPPNVERHFLTRTCIVDTKCKDASDATLRVVAGFLSFGGANDGAEDIRDRVTNQGAVDDDQFASEEDDIYDDTSTTTATPDDTAMNNMLANISCVSIKPFCFMGEYGSFIQMLCPKTCGLCDVPNDEDGGGANPRDPQRYRAASVHYHAHLLGNEMYTTLLRPTSSNEDIPLKDASLTQKRLDLLTESDPMNDGDTNMMVKDLKSREMWHFDDQATISFDKEFAIDVNTNDNELVRGLEILPGDKIQATCVFNSKGRDEVTRFGLSTYDEMCIIGVNIVFETPIVDAAVSLVAELNLRLFSCVNDDENHTTDIWQGVLETDEDPRNIWRDHPIEESDQCIFSVESYVFAELMTGGSRNCPADLDAQAFTGEVCYGFDTEGNDDEIEFVYDAIAGYTCVGGMYDQKDSNEAPSYITPKQCINEGGGSAYTYYCSDVQFWLDNESMNTIGMTDEVIEYARTEWYQPKCCRAIVDVVEEGNDTSVDADGSDGKEEDKDSASSSNEDILSTTDLETELEESSASFSLLGHVVSSVVVIMVASIFITVTL